MIETKCTFDTTTVTSWKSDKIVCEHETQSQRSSNCFYNTTLLITLNVYFVFKTRTLLVRNYAGINARSTQVGRPNSLGCRYLWKETQTV